MKNEIIEKLYEPLEVKERQGFGGKVFKYIASEDIVDRMNRVFAGNWRTEVLSDKIIEEQVLMLVRVTVFDQEERVEYYQEGYASHPILRFTGGQNKGKILDIGNVYRSAMSKAIKTACSKWGIGLYLEEDSSQSFGETPSFGGTPSVIPNPVIPAPPTPVTPTVPPIVPTNVQAVPTPVVNVPPAPVVNTPVAPPVNAYAPPVILTMTTNVPPSIPTSVLPIPPITNTTPVQSNIPFSPPIKSPVNNAINDNPTSIFTDSSVTDPEKITPVQRVAVETVMTANNLTFNVLCINALGRQTDLPETIESVSYFDAVKMIQYGNDININN